jgi:glutamine synthetase
VIAELEAFLAAHPDIEAAEAFVTDPNGVARGKLLRRCELASLYRDGRAMPVSIMSLDLTGREVDQTGLIRDAGDPDKLALPVAGTLTRAPWWQVPTAQLLLSLWEPDGAPHVADPRHVLAGVVARLEAAGYFPVVAAELEFYVVDPRRGPDQRLRHPRAPATGRRLEHVDLFSTTALAELAPFIDELFAAAELVGLPAQTTVAEAAPGQLEIVLRHRPDAVRAADDAVRWKRLVRGVAARHGLLATFMAKPFSAHAGSGLHLHLSLADAAGRNLFASHDPAGSPLMCHAIGGLLASLEDSLGIFAPHANSYRRYQAGTYAPTSSTWGINNRSVAIRIPTGPPDSRHLEHRVAGADANPYLAIAVALAALHRGIVEQLDPGPRVEGDASGRPGKELPRDWRAAIHRLGHSDFLDSCLGVEFARIYHAIKSAEHTRFTAQVTELDLDWCLTRA